MSADVTPIRPPEEPPAPPPPPDGPPFSLAAIAERIDHQCEAIVDPMAIIELAVKELQGISGDEDPVDLAALSSQWAHALTGAAALLSDAVECLEKIRDEVRRAVS